MRGIAVATIVESRAASSSVSSSPATVIASVRRERGVAGIGVIKSSVIQNLPCQPLGSLDRGELGLRPFRVHDELERIELLVQRAQRLERLLAQLEKVLRIREAVESKLDESQCQGVLMPTDQRSGALGEGFLPATCEQRERRCPFIRGEHFDALTVRLPVAGTLVVDAFDEVLA